MITAGVVTAFAVGVAAVTIPVALVSHAIRVLQLAEIQMNEALAGVFKLHGTLADELTEEVLDEILDAIRTTTGGQMQVLTPSPVYYVAHKDGLAEEVARKFGPANAVTQRFRMLERRGDDFIRATIAFPGKVHFMVPDMRQKRVAQAWTARRERLDGNDREITAKFTSLCSSLFPQIRKQRKAAGRATAKHHILALSRVRVLLLPDRCYAQELPADRPGIMAKVWRINRDRPDGTPNPAYLVAESILAAYRKWK